MRHTDVAQPMLERGKKLEGVIGEGSIYRLRTTVYDHVQRMPLQFFTRTQTGALVSRLNNDVIGAQQAFTSTLSGVVSNAIQLARGGVVPRASTRAMSCRTRSQ